MWTLALRGAARAARAAVVAVVAAEWCDAFGVVTRARVQLELTTVSAMPCGTCGARREGTVRAAGVDLRHRLPGGAARKPGVAVSRHCCV